MNSSAADTAAPVGDGQEEDDLDLAAEVTESTRERRERPGNALDRRAHQEARLDPFAREVLAQMRQHNTDELALNREGFEAVRKETAGLREDLGSMFDRMDKRDRSNMLAIVFIVALAIIAVVGVAGVQIRASALGATIGTGGAPTTTPIADQPAP